MRRTLWLIPLAGLLALAAALMLKPSPIPAQANKTGAGGTAVPAVKAQALQLPIAQVVLFSSGVGYFQREGDVEGNARIDLSFPVTDINDLLKSMVLQDLGGGHVSTVSCDSHDPIQRTLKSFALDLTGNPGFGELLHQARGEKVEVVMQTSTNQPGTLTGTIVSIETQRQAVGKDGVVDVALLNLLTADGVRSIRLGEIQRVRFLNPTLESELKRALDVLALTHDTQKKAVSLSFTGEGKRPVRVGYVIEHPIWKTSYRLVLASGGRKPAEGKPESKPFLQGWAIVENPSDEDWNNVRMGLISGRPISFQMDLYQPLYVPRPTVEPELFASLRPPTYAGAMVRDVRGEPVTAATVEKEITFHGERKKVAEEKSKSMAAEPHGNRRPEMSGVDPYPGLRAGGRLNRSMDLAQGVSSAATAQEMGDFFQYAIEHPVTLPRQKSAMLPIVNQAVEGTKVSIYNQAVHAKFPLHGLKFKNTSGLHLMQGPITVFEGNSYAGDARVLDLQPNEERLLSYAIDLGMEVEPVFKGEPDRLTAVKITKGILYATRKLRESRTFNIKNRSEHDRKLIIEHAFRPEFKLVTPEKPSERSREVYRFELPVAAGHSAKQEIVEERDLVQTVALTNSDDQQIRIFLQSNVTSPKVKDALTKAVELKGKVSATQRDSANLNRQLQEITQDQGRLRANLKEMPPTAAAYKRYLEKFDKQETEIEQLQADIKKLQQTEHKQRGEYEAYLANLNVE